MPKIIVEYDSENFQWLALVAQSRGKTGPVEIIVGELLLDLCNEAVKDFCKHNGGTGLYTGPAIVADSIRRGK